MTPHEVGPVWSGNYLVAGFAVTVSCTQPNVIDVWALSQPAGATTATSTTFDKAVCQASSCTASTAWAVEYVGAPICWVDAGDGGGVDFGKDVTPIPPERCA